MVQAGAGSSVTPAFDGAADGASEHRGPPSPRPLAEPLGAKQDAVISSGGGDAMSSPCGTLGDPFGAVTLSAGTDAASLDSALNRSDHGLDRSGHGSSHRRRPLARPSPRAPPPELPELPPELPTAAVPRADERMYCDPLPLPSPPQLSRFTRGASREAEGVSSLSAPSPVPSLSQCGSTFGAQSPGNGAAVAPPSTEVEARAPWTFETPPSNAVVRTVATVPSSGSSGDQGRPEGGVAVAAVAAVAVAEAAETNGGHDKNEGDEDERGDRDDKCAVELSPASRTVAASTSCVRRLSERAPCHSPELEDDPEGNPESKS